MCIFGNDIGSKINFLLNCGNHHLKTDSDEQDTFHRCEYIGRNRNYNYQNTWEKTSKTHLGDNPSLAS